MLLPAIALVAHMSREELSLRTMLHRLELRMWIDAKRATEEQEERAAHEDHVGDDR